MAESSPTSSLPGEKGTFVDPPAPTQKKRKFAFWKKDEKGEKASIGDLETEVKPKEEEIPPVSFGQLFRFATKFELALDAVGLAAAIATGAAQPLMTLFFAEATQNFVDFTVAIQQVQLGVPDADQLLSQAAQAFRRSSATNATYFVYLGVALFVCTYTYMYIWVYTGEVNAKRIRERYLKAILRQDIAYFDDIGAGEVTTRIQTDTHLIQTGTSEKVALTFQYIGSFLTGFILAYARSWRLALAMSSILPVIAITGGIMNAFVSRFAALALKHTAEGGSFAEETISTVRTAQAFGVQKILSKRYNTHINGSLNADLNGAVWQGGGFAVFFFVVYAAYGLAFSFGMTLLNRGQANVSEVINVFLAILIGSFSLAMLAPELQAINQACGAAAKVYATIDRVPAIDSADPGGEKPEKVDGEITLEEVKFSYPSRPTIEVVKGLNLTFKAGQYVALVGASGSGKSTIISLVERFYDPTSGVLRLDGRNLKDLNLKWLRSQIGLVSQEPVLFSTTIKGNVAHGLINTPFENASEEVKDKLIKDACIKANADGFITNLPMGYDTMVGERGFLLSGGQKQRVAIARAIVSDPKILLLDEATSALDTRSEGVVQDALDKASAGRTTIAIAHRLSTIKDADIIYVMGEGCVLESGSHSQLIQANGAYARLVQAQKLNERHDDPEDEPPEVEKPTEKELAEEVPLGRSNTHRSLASEILEKRQQDSVQDESPHDDHGLPYLFRRLAPIISDQKWYYILGGFFACLTGMIYPAFGVVFAKGLDAFAMQTPAERRFAGDRTALWLFIISVGSFITVGCQYYMFARSAATLTARLRERVYKAILRQDIEYFDRDENSTGALTSGLSENPQKVNGLAGTTLGAIVQCISTLVSGSILGLVFLWKAGLVGMACTPILIAMGFIRLRVVVLKDQVNRKAHSQSAQVACEAAGSIRTVAALTREDDCLHVYSNSLEGPLQHSKKQSVWSSLLFALSQASVYFVIALLFWYGSLLVSRFEATMFEFFIALMSTTFAALDAGEMFSYVPDMSSARGAGSKIIKLFDSVPDIDADSLEGKKLDSATIKGHVVVDNVHFRYPTRPGVRVVRGLSLEIKPGQYVALVGASGCGKSTLIQLLERFYDPLAGEIYFDGEKISEYNVQEYRKQLALVSQEPTLYAGTIRFNILLGAVKPADEVTEEEIERACRDANIWDFVQGLPDKLDTEVGGKGSQLSGGQKQRIAIARALIRNPKLLLLDEATSALDSNSEKVVQEALDRAAKGRTTVAIAHRLSTIQNADVIYFIKDGQVSEAGTHNQLLEKKGDYFEYVQLQTLGDRK